MDADATLFALTFEFTTAKCSVYQERTLVSIPNAGMGSVFSEIQQVPIES